MIYANQAAQATQQTTLGTVLSAISSANERLLSVRMALDSKVGELLGNEPSGQTGNKLQAVGVGGVSGALTEQCEGLHAIISDVEHLLSRLQTL